MYPVPRKKLMAAWVWEAGLIVDAAAGVSGTKRCLWNTVLLNLCAMLQPLT